MLLSDMFATKHQLLQGQHTSWQLLHELHEACWAGPRLQSLVEGTASPQLPPAHTYRKGF